MKLTGGQAILQLHPSRRCNLSCRHCCSLSGPEVDAALPLALLQQVTREAAGLGYRVVGVSGGEPLLYPELPSLLRTAKGAGMRTTVTTNGMLLTERRLSELVPLTDVLAISLDGHPDSHNRLRGNPRAFGVLDRRMKAVERSGIPCAFITTLTLENLAELEFVVAYAQAHGAGGVQVHPLEPEGAALDNLAECVPDAREFVFAIVEGARLSQRYGIPVQVDLAHRAALLRHPEAFLALAPDPPRPLSSWQGTWLGTWKAVVPRPSTGTRRSTGRPVGRAVSPRRRADLRARLRAGRRSCGPGRRRTAPAPADTPSAAAGG
ncbi:MULTISPECIES: radical SAM protein [unclassified Streptomyces]|uniref:radical SAM protein n=1 Tax=Streptomyces TaxID=1883 RepID=UPI000895C1A8|nr:MULTISPECIES: radical SAM protein [unclassified Streptomyces]SEB68676.1 Radical SAM superfamily enzyme, MoaA/NifB/PqqE/SkfB family [Streptomyces sp. PAN_FS17]SEE22637.1 Radical SAM superfamily enzyme, MoaA/NifB/PqqE/SkfB family [Streptomyces sp. KS_5]